MDEVITFINARLDEDEAALRDDDDDQPGELRFGEMDDRTARYTWRFANNDRVRREIEAKRTIVAMYQHEMLPTVHEPEREVQELIEQRVDVLEDVLLTLAAVWSDHPDYQPEWPE